MTKKIHYISLIVCGLFIYPLIFQSFHIVFHHSHSAPHHIHKTVNTPNTVETPQTHCPLCEYTFILHQSAITSEYHVIVPTIPYEYASVIQEELHVNIPNIRNPRAPPLQLQPTIS